ncbi:unnamed protein product [Rotaria socialis]|uniref:DUF4817 domain-containing protein n=1 Tax=Rotaria socialis TaxID=392032 RepID=A0A818EWQ5_9BILA|nr:unnamed protein product [Rotaria socialis]CAF4603622.1 unnamed protein product [Rotaria socialis]
MTKEQRIFILKFWWESGRTLQTLNTAFRREFPGEKIPTRQAIYLLVKNFEETGSVEDASRSGRPTTLSQRRAALELNISRTNLRRLMKNLNLKPFKPRLLQALNENDPDRRLEFCECLLDSAGDDPTLLDRILWTEEASFQTNGRVNKHNCVYWSDTNPHFIIEQELNVLRLIVWGGIWSYGVVGPFFFDDNVASQTYTCVLEDNIIPQLQDHPAFPTMI